MNGNYSTSGNITASKTWKSKEFTFRMNSSLGGSYNRNMSRIDKQNIESKTYGINARLFLTGTYKDLLNLMPSYSVRFNDSKYSVAQNQDASSITHMLAGDFFINWPKQLIIENNISYIYNSRIAPGFKKGVVSWNAAANYQLFKNKQGVLRFAIYDILQQNTNVNRTISQNYIQDVQVDVLQQYYQLSFLYTFQRFGGMKN